MIRQYSIISGDSHLEVRADRWTHRVPAKYRDQAPRMVTLPDGADGIVVAGHPPAHNPMDLYGGRGRGRWLPLGERYDETPGTGPPEQRLRELDEDGVDAEVLYPSVNCGPKVWDGIEDMDARRAVFRAYNEWLAEEYCAAAPERLFGLGAMPITCVDDAIDEMESCRRLGLRGVVLRAFPHGGGYPLPEDDKFWAAAVDMDMPVSIHVSLDRSGPRDGPLLLYPKEVPEEFHTDLARQLARFGRPGGASVVQLVLGGVFDRFPTLRIDMAENQIGWVPLFMETADVRYGRHIGWTEELLGFKRLKQLPSEYIRQHIYWGFQQDRSGVELRDHMGVDRLIWGADFPHVESEWPHSHRVIAHNFAGVPEDETYRMVCGNAIEFFRLDR